MPWLPDEAMIIGWSDTAAVVTEAAPRILNDPVNWKVAALNNSVRPLTCGPDPAAS